MLNSAPKRINIITPITPPNPVFVKPDSPVSSGSVIKFDTRVVRGFDGVEVSKLLSSVTIQDEETLLERINFLLFDNNALPPYGKNILPNLDSLSDGPKLLAAAIVAMNVMMFANSNPAFADEPQNRDIIEWSLNALAKPDIIEVILNQKIPNGIHNGEFKPTASDMVWMIKNLHEEGSVLSDAGRLGIMLSVLERMKSSEYPPGMAQVILQLHQYSWTGKLLKNDPSPLPGDLKLANYLKIAGFANKNLPNTKSIDEAIEGIRNSIRLAFNNPNLFIPNGLIDYHVLNMRNIKRYSQDVKSETTRKKIILLEYLQANVNTPLNVPELDNCKKHFLYIPHPKELSDDPRVREEYKGRGHIHYSSHFKQASTIDRLFQLVKDGKEKLDNWGKN